MQVVMGVNYITVRILGILKDVVSFSLILICLRTSSTYEKTLPKEDGSLRGLRTWSYPRVSFMVYLNLKGGMEAFELAAIQGLQRMVLQGIHKPVCLQGNYLKHIEKERRNYNTKC